MRTLFLLALLPVLAAAQPAARWSLTPQEAPSGKPFTVQLLNPNYGDCRHAFSYLVDQVYNGTLDLTFKVAVDSTKPCPDEIRPWGPKFEIAALNTGDYPVRFWAAPACYPDCHVIPQFILLDTLAVKATVGLAISTPAQPFARALVWHSGRWLAPAPGSAGATGRRLLNGARVPEP